MQIAIISDIHGNHVALRTALARIRERGVREILCLGDLCGYYSFVEECLGLLQPLPTLGVRGNHDQVMLEARAGCDLSAYEAAYGRGLKVALPRLSDESWRALASLPTRRELKLGGRRILMCHGSPWQPLEGRVYPDSTEWQPFRELAVDVVLMGHTHHPLIRHERDMLLVNPGSVGQARDRSGVASLAFVDLDRRTAELEQIPYDAAEIVADATAHSPELPYLTQVLSR